PPVLLQPLPDPSVPASAPPCAGGRAAPPDGVGGGTARPRLTHGERARAARAPPRRARVRALRRDPRARGGGGPAGGRGASGARARWAPPAGGGPRPDGPGLRGLDQRTRLVRGARDRHPGAAGTPPARRPPAAGADGARG